MDEIDMVRMKQFEKLLNESCDRLFEISRSGDLAEWNKTQLLIWMELARKGYVNIDDATTFGKFGEFFYNHWKRTGTLPTPEKFVQDNKL